MTLRVLIPVTGAFHGRLRVKRSTGALETEGLDRILSTPSVRAVTLAKQLRAHDAHLVAVHVDKGGGEEVLREALAHGLDQGILIEGAKKYESDASTRAATIADVYAQNGPFDAVIGPARSSFHGFTGTLAAVAAHLDLPCVIGARSIEPSDSRFKIGYQSMFGDYDLEIPRPCVVMPGEIPVDHPTGYDIHDAYERGIMRVHADQYTVQKALAKRLRIEAVRGDKLSPENVDGATLVRRLRSRGILPEAEALP